MPAPSTDRPTRAPARRGRRVRFLLGWWALCFGLWVLLVFKTELAELVAGAISAAVAATAAELVRSRGYAPFAGELSWLRALRRLPREVVRDSALLLRAVVLRLVRGVPIEGRFRVVRFPDCAGRDPKAEGRRAAAKWLGSFSPNAYVVGFDEQRDIALIHELVPADEPPRIDPSERS
jgi:hypothetical protein